MKQVVRDVAPSVVLTVLDWLERAGVRVWLDGGWGVDALLRRHTRTHDDIDVIVSVGDVQVVLEAGAEHGFAIRDGSPPHAFVLANDTGLCIDVHAVTFDRQGNATHVMDEGRRWEFSTDSFDGVGVIEGATVRCLSPEAQVRCHAQGYTPTETDLHDIELLQEVFGVDVPPRLRRGAART